MTNAVSTERREVVASPLSDPSVRRAVQRLRTPRNDAWLAASGMIGALLALPLAQTTWHGAEVAAVLAVSATALLAGQRWAIALIVIADVLLIPTVWPRALAGGLESRCVALVTLAALVPGILAMRRAAAVLVVMTGRRRTHRMCHRVHCALIAICVLAALVPLL
jgi:hypothetical protein